jgi:DNA gyrase/topoisomerase IV subunit B
MQNQETKIYKWKEHIRKRPGMYIGDLRLTGFKQMLEYLFEEILKDCFENPIFEIAFFQDNKITIKIINADTKKFLLRLDELQTTDDRISGLGLGVFITLSSDISIEIHDLPTLVVLFGQKGDFEIAATTSSEEQKCIIISYTADKEIFKDFELVYEQVNSFLCQFTFLNPNLKIISIDKTTDEFQRNVFYYPTGVFKQLDYFISQQPYGIPSLRVDIEANIEEYSYRIGISYSNIWLDKSVIKTYAGNIETYFGGSLNNGILEGLILSIRKIAQKENVDIVINRKLVKEQLIIIAAVRGEEFNFEGSMKRRLGMPKLQKDVRQLVCGQMTSYFDLNPKAAEAILHKFKRWE